MMQSAAIESSTEKVHNIQTKREQDIEIVEGEGDFPGKFS